MSAADELTAGLRAELDRVNDRLAEPLLDLRQEAWKKIGEAAQQDIPDLIAGALGVSRGTAYDMMREALAEQPAQQEPVAWMHEWEDGERIPMLLGRDDRNDDKPKTVRPLVYGDTSPQPPAQQEPVAIYRNKCADGSRCLHGCHANEPCYTTPQPPAQPLTDEQILDAYCKTPGIFQFVSAFKAGARYAEAAHGITKGQP